MPMITWAETRRRLQEDRRRLRDYCGGDGRSTTVLAFHPSYQCVLMSRLSFYCFSRGWRLLARLFWQTNMWLTGADIAPLSDIGGGWIVDCPASSVIVGRVGRNFTSSCQAGVGGGMTSRRDIGAGPGLPVIGDDVTLGPGALVMGPVRVGDRVTIGARCAVTTDVPSDTMVEPHAPVFKANLERSSEGVIGRAREAANDAP